MKENTPFLFSSPFFSMDLLYKYDVIFHRCPTKGRENIFGLQFLLFIQPAGSSLDYSPKIYLIQAILLLSFNIRRAG